MNTERKIVQYELAQYKRNGEQPKHYTFYNEELAKKVFDALEVCDDAKIELYKIETTFQLLSEKVYEKGEAI